MPPIRVLITTVMRLQVAIEDPLGIWISIRNSAPQVGRTFSFFELREPIKDDGDRRGLLLSDVHQKAAVCGDVVLPGPVHAKTAATEPGLKQRTGRAQFQRGSDRGDRDRPQHSVGSHIKQFFAVSIPTWLESARRR